MALGIRIYPVALIAVLSSLNARADLKSVEEAQQKLQSAFTDRFLNFTKDKNVMGKTQTPDGKTQLEGRKSRFDKDGGGVLPFQSDLTYHDFSFNRTDPNDQNNKEDDRSRLFAFVSHHGGVSAAGGSSLLERTVYQLHKLFSKEDEKNAKQQDKEEGVKYRSVFKITTQEVFDKDGAAKNDKNAEKDEPEKVERVELRGEAKDAVTKVGEDTFETIQRAGRDAGFEDDPNTLPNSVLLRQAAGQATLAWWNSALANLGQRRANSGIRAGLLPDAPQLSEGVANCDEWGAAVQEGVQGAKADPQTQKNLTQEIQQKVQQCKQMNNTSYKTINPRFVRDAEGKGETLQTGDLKKEDAFQRDERNQLEILAKAGTDVQKLQTNWQYKAEDGQSKVKRQYENGRAVGEDSVTVREQLESYNDQLKAAAKGIEEAKTRLPELDMNDPNQYEILPETRSAVDINQTRVMSAFEEARINEVGNPEQAADTYQELLDTN